MEEEEVGLGGGVPTECLCLASSLLLSIAFSLCSSALSIHGVLPLSPSPGPQVRTIGQMLVNIFSNKLFSKVRTWDLASFLCRAFCLCSSALLKCVEGWGSPLPVSSQDPNGGICDCEGWGSPLPGVRRPGLMPEGVGVDVEVVVEQGLGPKGVATASAGVGVSEGWGSPLQGVLRLWLRRM